MITTPGPTRQAVPPTTYEVVRRQQVAFVVVDETESPVLVTQTLPAELIRPADPGAPPS